jgi:sugar lactone lactonase YvrE
MTAPIGGGSVSTLVSGGTGYGIAIDASNVYWTDFRAGNVMQMPLGGGAITTLASDQYGPIGFGMDADNVYFSNAMGQTVVLGAEGRGDAAHARDLSRRA